MNEDSPADRAPPRPLETASYYEILPALDPASPLLFLCDHASNAIPDAFKSLGLDGEQLRRHIAYDPGAEGVTRHLANHFGAGALLTRFSRLLIDPNRAEDDPTLIMRIADRAVVPGNRALNANERDARLNLFYRPYHNAITAALDGLLTRDILPVIISIHSFTEAWRGLPRPWQFSILWDQDKRIAGPLMEALRQDPELVVGDNEPYTGTLRGDTMWRHGTERNIPHALIEVRQDLIRNEAGQRAAAERLAKALEQTLNHLKFDQSASV